jgi:hypothetical protein
VITYLSLFIPSVDSDNTWTLANDNTWTSKLTQGDYTVTVNLSGARNGVNVRGLNSITTAVDTVKQTQPTVDGLPNLNGISRISSIIS